MRGIHQVSLDPILPSFYSEEKDALELVPMTGSSHQNHEKSRKILTPIVPRSGAGAGTHGQMNVIEVPDLPGGSPPMGAAGFTLVLMVMPADTGSWYPGYGMKSPLNVHPARVWPTGILPLRQPCPPEEGGALRCPGITGRKDFSTRANRESGIG